MIRARKTWLITDTHFNHVAMIERAWRPTYYQEMILRNWRRLVMPQDLIYHLGDVILGRDSELAYIMRDLPGNKILIRGNHDHHPSIWYERAGFSSVHHGILINGAWLTHAPQTTMPDGAIINIHGHLHGDAHRAQVAELPAYCKLLALEHPQVDYAPVELSQFSNLSPLQQLIMAE